MDMRAAGRVGSAEWGRARLRLWWDTSTPTWRRADGLPRFDHPQRVQVVCEIEAGIGHEEVVRGSHREGREQRHAQRGQFGAVAERFSFGASQAEAAVGWAEGGCVHGK